MFIVGNFGLYRSDDGGDSLATDGRGRPARVANGQGGYNCGVYVNPKNPDIVYVINTSSYISTDGGKTFTGFKGAPGGDDPQQMWLDPTDGKRTLPRAPTKAPRSPWTAARTGALGTTSRLPRSITSPPTISSRTGFMQPSRIAAAWRTASRGNLGAITPMDWLPHPGYEFGYIVADPLNPKITYAGGPGGGIVKVTYPNGQWINVSPSVDTAGGYRKVGNQPLGFSPTNPHELFAGFQYLMASTDGGMHWKKLSPDLGYPRA